MSNKILLVEDEKSTANYIYHKLEQLECDVMAKASTSQDAIKLAKDLKPNLILLDIKLGDEVDGIDTASQILSFLDVPVVYITSHSDEDTIKRLMKVEPNAFIIKPFDERILRSAIDIAVYRHQVKKDLLEIKELLRTTIESIDDILISFDCKGIIRYVNSSNQRNIPFLINDKWISKHYNKVFHDKFIKLLDVSFDNLLKTGKLQEFNLESDKSWYHCKAFIKKNIDNKYIGVTLLISDITPPKKTEQGLVVNKEKLTEAQELAKLGTCEIDFTQNKLFHNNIFFQLLEIDDCKDINSLDNKKILDIIHPEDKKRYIDYYKDIFDKKNKKLSIDCRIINKDKKIRYMHLAGRVVYDKSENPLSMLLTLQDISWKEHEKEFRKNLFAQEKIAEIKKQFFDDVSYHLKTPLTEIVGTIGLLGKTELSEEQAQLLNTLKDSSETLINTINDISDITKIQTGKIALAPSAYNIRKDLERIIGKMQWCADKKNIIINSYVDDKVPASIYVDSKRVNQVIYNLVSNAIKFTKDGSVDIKILIDSGKGKELTLKIAVKDTGIGISNEDLPFLFKSLHEKLAYSKKCSLGPGLGLYICKNITNVLGGNIKVDSVLGEGSTFWFTFKAQQYKESNLVKDTSISQETIPNDLDMSVLLVEDKDDNQKVLSMMLESIGCQVKVASNGKEAIKIYQETVINAFDIFDNIKCDIIIMDIYMPVMNGIEATKELKDKYDELPPIIGMTTRDLKDNLEEHEKSDFDDYLNKPITIKRLAEKLFYWKNKKRYKKPGILSDESFTVYVENYPVANDKTINKIIGHLGNISIKDFFNSFNEDMDNYYNKALKAFNNDDYTQIKYIVTTIKGLSASIGASQIHEISKRMQFFAEENDFEKVKELFSLLADKYIEFKKHIEKKYI